MIKSDSRAAATGRCGERGANTVEYLATLLVVATVAAVLLSSGLVHQFSARVEYALCLIFRHDGTCAVPAPFQPPQLANEPQLNCLVSNQQEYWDSYLQVGEPIGWSGWSVGESQLKLRHLITPDGKDLWQVWDDSFTGPGLGFGLEGAGLFMWGIYDRSKVYQFSNEKQARAFYDYWRQRRLGGGGTKAAIRENFATRFLVDGLDHLPWIGKKIQDWTGGGDPAQRPDLEYNGAGVIGGVADDTKLGIFDQAIPIKGAAWQLNELGVLSNNTNGETTLYYTNMSKAHQSAVLPAVADLNLPDAVVARMWGVPVATARLIKSSALAQAAQLGLHAGVGIRAVVIEQPGITFDKHGRVVGISNLLDVQFNLITRVGGNLGTPELTVGGWKYQAIPNTGGRMRVTLNLDTSNTADNKAALDRLTTDMTRLHGTDALHDLGQYLADHGAMTVVAYGGDPADINPSVNVAGVVGLDLQHEAINNPGQWAVYYDPHTGTFRNWTRCGLKGAPSWLAGG